MLKFILIILDGFGLRHEKYGNAVAQAYTPTLDQMMTNCPMSYIETSGKHVGLPDGIMGNSEVGHMNLGAGRIVKQNLVRINDDISSNKLASNANLQALFNHVNQNKSTLHIMGLLSDGGVHSHIDHFKYILDVAKLNNVEKISCHIITDGRDSSPFSGISFSKQLELYLNNNKNINISSVCGRYYAMDRDSRWDRIEKAYRLYVYNEGETFSDIETAIQYSYNKGITDEFILPSIIGNPSPVQNGDAILTMNFRADRMRQIVSAFNDEEFPHFKNKSLDILFSCMTKYQENFSYPVLFEPEIITNIFPEILANHNYRQLRIAETEKYAHVTYFFNGGEEKNFDGESRCMIPSPKVSTYDLKPEMSAFELTNEVLMAIENDQHEAIIMNFANPDMVGHTGNLKAAIQAIETIDTCLNKIRNKVKEKYGTIFLTADHGNLEMMIDPETKQVHTAHTILPVPLIMDCYNGIYELLKYGKLADIAPTILDYLGIKKPDEMTGNSLLIPTHD